PYEDPRSHSGHTSPTSRAAANRLLASAQLRRQNNAGLAADPAVVLDAPVALEVEDRLLPEHGGVEIAIGDDELVLLGTRFDHDLPVGIDDHAACDQGVPVLGAAFRD